MNTSVRSGRSGSAAHRLARRLTPAAVVLLGVRFASAGNLASCPVEAAELDELVVEGYAEAWCKGAGSDFFLLARDERTATKLRARITEICPRGVGGGPAGRLNFRDGEIKLAGFFSTSGQTTASPSTRIRPAPIGASIGHGVGDAGTLGARVRDRQGSPKKTYLLSNWHVLAPNADAREGDPIYQPAGREGAKAEANVVARLARGVGPSPGNHANELDAALAETPASQVDPTFGGKQLNPTPKSATAAMDVTKYGRTTRLTQGEVFCTDATVRVLYGEFMTFVRQIIVVSKEDDGVFCDDGDSGSMVVSDDGAFHAVGLLFANATLEPRQSTEHSTIRKACIATPIETVLRELDVEIDP